MIFKISQSHYDHNNSDFHFMVKARLVLLNSNQQTFLSDDSKVIEISEIVEGFKNIDDIKKSFPKQSVSKLKEGDLIVLRTGGSGDYTQSIADILMKKDGLATLREEAALWKNNLQTALFNHSPSKVAAMLRNRGESISSPNYLWYWATDQIIGPESYERFLNLLKVLEDLNCTTTTCKVDMSNSFWEKMKQVRHYHHSAGNSVREALLKRLKKVLKKGIIVNDSMPLSIPGMSSAELSILRVAAVDNKISNIPYNRVGVLMDL